MTTATIDWDGLTHARRALIANPFRVPPEELQRAASWFAFNVADVPIAVSVLCETQHKGDARKLALAAIHASVRAGRGPNVAGLAEALAANQQKGLRLTAADAQRLGAALDRFQAAIGRLLGDSVEMEVVRGKVWSACFGENLYATLDSETELRRFNVLILGETGTGKELVADAIQAAALTLDEPPSIGLNCAALPAQVAESELFGYERGAHSTATARREGKLVAADGGSLFLDEVGDLPPEVETKLLSVIQNGKVTPLGTNTVREVDVRYIAATSLPLEQRVATGNFRRDLYERLAGQVIRIPPLRERREDVVTIGRRLLGDVRQRRAGAEAGHGENDLSSRDAMFSNAREHMETEWLRAQSRDYDWPGNVRELERAIRRRTLGLESDQAPQASRRNDEPRELSDVERRIEACTATEAEVVDWYMRKVWNHVDGNLAKVDEILNVDRTTLRRRGLKGNPSSSTRKGRQPAK